MYRPSRKEEKTCRKFDDQMVNFLFTSIKNYPHWMVAVTSRFGHIKAMTERLEFDLIAVKSIIQRIYTTIWTKHSTLKLFGVCRFSSWLFSTIYRSYLVDLCEQSFKWKMQIILKHSIDLVVGSLHSVHWWVQLWLEYLNASCDAKVRVRIQNLF